jgi:hypothetical protein
MKPWRRTSSRRCGDGKATSEVGAIIKFRANLVDSLGEMPTSRRAICSVSMRLVAQKEPILKKANSALLRGSRFPWADFKPSRYGSRGVRFIWP